MSELEPEHGAGTSFCLGWASQQLWWDGERAAVRLWQHENHPWGQLDFPRGRWARDLGGEKQWRTAGLHQWVRWRLKGRLGKRCISSHACPPLISSRASNTEGRSSPASMKSWGPQLYPSKTHSHWNLQRLGIFGTCYTPLPILLWLRVGLCCCVGFHTPHGIRRKEEWGHRGPFTSVSRNQSKSFSVCDLTDTALHAFWSMLEIFRNDNV